jgi:hypothetical protein
MQNLGGERHECIRKTIREEEGRQGKGKGIKRG